MDSMEKLQKYNDYKQIETINIEDKIETAYRKNTHKLKNDAYKYGFGLETRDFLEIIDEASGNPNGRIENINIIYDEKRNKLNMYQSDDWQAFLIESGMRNIIMIIKENYFDAYEVYLIKKIEGQQGDAQKRAEYKELLDEYYKFIATFDIEPLVKNRSNSEILDDDDSKDWSIENNTLQDTYMPKYKAIRESIKTTERKAMTKQVLDIIKRNSKSNIIDLNKKIITLFHMDEGFKNLLVNDLISE